MPWDGAAQTIAWVWSLRAALDALPSAALSSHWMVPGVAVATYAEIEVGLEPVYCHSTLKPPAGAAGLASSKSASVAAFELMLMLSPPPPPAELVIVVPERTRYSPSAMAPTVRSAGPVVVRIVWS